MFTEGNEVQLILIAEPGTEDYMLFLQITLKCFSLIWSVAWFAGPAF